MSNLESSSERADQLGRKPGYTPTEVVLAFLTFGISLLFRKNRDNGKVVKVENSGKVLRVGGNGQVKKVKEVESSGEVLRVSGNGQVKRVERNGQVGRVNNVTFFRAKKRWMDESGQFLHTAASVLSFQTFAEGVERVEEELFERQVVISFEIVKLVEAREGARVTNTSGTFQGKTRAGTVGINVGRVGLAATSAKTRGSINTTSISAPIEEEMTTIDTGQVVLEKSLLTYVGEKYSRSTTYSNIIGWKTGGNIISISVIGGDKNWQLAFGEESDAIFVDSLLRSIEESKKGTVGKELLLGLLPLATLELGRMQKKRAELEKSINDFVTLANASGRKDAFRIYG